MQTLAFGYSPCPNDTFMFHGVASGRVSVPGITLAPLLLDIEELNARALAGDGGLEITKLSVATWGAVRDRYELLDAGAALGSGCGPLVVRAATRHDVATLSALRGARVAIPGANTTAALLLAMFAPADLVAVPMRFDQIVAAVARGEVDAGVIIHETRFTYADHGLVAVADLGERWEKKEGLPLPLGVIAARRDLPAATRAAIAAALRASIELARAQPELSAAYVQEHARELSASVCRRHIDLYVNDWSVSLGNAGRAAIDVLLRRARG